MARNQKVNGASREPETPKPKRRRGRPKGRSDPSIPWEEIELAFIHGIAIDHDPESESLEVPNRKWPTFAEVGKRFGCSASLVHRRAHRYNWIERRDAFKQRFTDQLDAELAKDLATTTAEQVAIIDRFTRQFSRNLEQKRVRADNVGDLDKALRLREFLLGHADTRTETEHVITLDEMQTRHMQARERALQLDPRETGMIESTGVNVEVPPSPPPPVVEQLVEGEVSPPVAESVETRQERVAESRKDCATRAPFDPLAPKESCRVPHERDALDSPPYQPSALNSTEHVET
jgi:hypothetical protein